MKLYDISVVICTYNRAHSLLRTLNSFDGLIIPDGLQWELLLVDNNSTDHTEAVVRKFIEGVQYPMRYLFEEKQGLSNARNRGIRDAEGEIIVFTDDDATVHKEWLANIDHAFKKHDPVCVGGKIKAEWEGDPPSWLKGNLLNILAITDLGNSEMVLDVPRIWGANLSIRADMFEKYGWFDTNLGNKGKKLYGGEETEMIEKMIKNGEKVVYSPDAIVHHHIPSSRMKKSYFRKWMFDKGELKAYYDGKYIQRNIFGIPLYIFRSIVEKFVRSTLKSFRDPQSYFKDHLSMIYDIGYAAGRIKFRRMNKNGQSDV